MKEQQYMYEIMITILRSINSLGPKSLTALTNRNENKYQISRLRANTTLS